MAGDRRRRRSRPRRALVAAAVTATALAGAFASALAAPAPAAPAPGQRAPAGPATGVATGAGTARLVAVAARPSVPAGARRRGPLAASTPLAGFVALAPSDGPALTAEATAVSTPGTAAYRHDLPAGAWARTLAAPAGRVAAVEADLRAGGLHVDTDAVDGLLVGFSGPAARVAAGFHTSLSSYRLADGTDAYAPDGPLRLPAAVAGDVTAVVGLDDTTAPSADNPASGATSRARAPGGGADRPDRTATDGGPSACAEATADAGAVGGLTDSALARAYGLDGLYQAGDTGQGSSVAVFELEPFAAADVHAFDTCYFGSSAAAAMAGRLHVRPVGGGQLLGPGSGESALDIDDVSALAPGAGIDVYEAPATTAGYLDELATIVGDDRDATVTSSWSAGCEAAVEATQPGLLEVEDTLLQQAALQGQSVLAASGDSGSDACAEHAPEPVAPVLSVADPAGQPWITAVGGTTVTDAVGPTPRQKVWDDGAAGGASGGGISAVWRQPAWQAAATVPGTTDRRVIAAAERLAGDDFCLAGTVGTAGQACREVPDVSASADEETGAITIRVEGRWTTIGGTSSAAPIWAAVLADVDASRACARSGPVGFADPALYAIASVPTEYAASFGDVTTGSSDLFGEPGRLYPAGPGYDMATGLGSPEVTGPADARGLAYYLCTPPSSAPPTVATVDPDVVAGSKAATVTVTGTGFWRDGASDVAGVEVGAYRVPAAAVTVAGPTTLRATLPAGAVEAGTGTGGTGAGTYAVTVTVVGGRTSRPAAAARLTVTDGPADPGVPDVVAVEPSAGNEDGGTTVTVYGAGFDAPGGVRAVRFGGVPAARYRVVSPTELLAVTPRWQPGGPGATACRAGDRPAVDVCQVGVAVTTAGGTSREVPIPAEYSGDLTSATSATTGIVPVATEFDYVPTPTIRRLSFPAGAPAYAGEDGGTVVTVRGTGLGVLGLEWVDVGPPDLAADQATYVEQATGTSLTLFLQGEPASSTPRTVDLSVQTGGSANVGRLGSAASPSNVVPVTYAPTPVVRSVSSATRLAAGPATGGTHLTIHGTGFVGATSVDYADTTGFGSEAQPDLPRTDTTSETTIDVVTPKLAPGVDAVAVCGVSGCSAAGDLAPPAAVFTFFPIGGPHLTGVTPRSAPAGTLVTIHGRNLGFADGVVFGSVRATMWENGPGPLDPGDTTTVYAVVPPGLRPGRAVAVRVETLESRSLDRDPLSPPVGAARFTPRR